MKRESRPDQAVTFTIQIKSMMRTCGQLPFFSIIIPDLVKPLGPVKKKTNKLEVTLWFPFSLGEGGRTAVFLPPSPLAIGFPSIVLLARCLLLTL